MSLHELEQRKLHFQHRLNMHYAERNSHNVNENYVQWLESRIEEVKKLIFGLKLANKKAA